MADANLTGALKGPADTVNQFLCIGDSITAGFGPSPASGGYRTQALSHCPNTVFTGRNYDFGWHEGYNGQRADQVLITVQPIIRILQPRNLVVLMGVNDINQGESIAATLTEIRSFCETLLAESPYIQHVFCSTLPIGATLSGLSGSSFNSGMAATFSGADSRIILVDMCSTLVPPTHFADGLHPNDLGYSIMGTALAAALHSVYPTL